MTMTTTLLLMYEIAQNNKIRDIRHNDTSNHFASENESNNTIHLDSTVNTDSFGGRILIVDDDPDITLSFSIGLEDGGLKVHTYNDPLDAQANFKPSFYYDLLLVDINMLKINGFELCTKILEVARNMPFEVSIAIDDIINLAANIYYICSTILQTQYLCSLF